MASPSVVEASPTSAAVLPTVIPTKLRAPRIRSELVERPELVARLREGRRRALTLVCAPAGYGKSTLLAQWVDSDRERTPFVWLALDPSDSDPTRLWAHLVTGLREVHAPVGEASLDALMGGPGAIADTLVPLLVRELADAPELVVVLDDWHLVRSPLCDATMAAFVEHAPDSVQVVVSSRADPGLPVARLRAHGELAELREAALRISAHEVLDLFRRADVELTNDEVERLNDRAEGWLAGICLALLVAKERPDPARFVEEFSGDTRHVLDFLADDVLAATPPEIRSFLLQTSMLDRLSADLCDAVLEISSSASLLDEIASANLFLVAVDEVGNEYRYHHLFGAMLERELRAADPAAPHRLHARASAWFEAHGDVDSAIEHAIASGDLERTSALVTLHAHPYLANGRHATVARWLDALSWPDAVADPQLAVVRANVNGMSGRPREEVERWLELAESSPDIGPLPSGIDSLRSAVGILRSAFLTRGIAAAIDEARSTLARQDGSSAWRGQTLTMLGQALYLAGRPDEARAPLEEARAIPGAAARAPSSAQALAYLALIAVDHGDRPGAELTARDALDLLVEQHLGTGIVAANAHLALGSALADGTDLHSAATHLRRAAELTAPATPNYWHVHALVRLASVLHRLGDAASAVASLVAARAELGLLPDEGMLGDLYETALATVSGRARRESFLGERLSDAELRIARALASGASLSGVARELYLSPNTVKTHRRRIYRKLGVTTRAELLEWAATLGRVRADSG
jgi:LuxR family transcriptional regulator, maltose regulon positive regulatory protein